MKLKNGDLYFISEKDVLTGAGSGYYKIGLVKESRRGDSSTRLDEHQTGNPRKLDIAAVVNSVAITDLESAMHYRFAAHRIFGEWFTLSEPELALAIKTATELAQTQSIHADAARSADTLEGEQSEDVIRPASSEARTIHRTALGAQAVLAETKGIEQEIKAFFRSATQDGLDVGLYAEFGQPGSATLDRTALKKAHPDIYATFIETQEVMQRPFKTLGQEQMSANADDLRAVSNEVTELRRLLGRSRYDDEHFREAHLRYLNLRRMMHEAEWITDFMIAELKTRCGTASGIEGLCTWTSSLRKKSDFNAPAFRGAHPDLAEQFTRTREPRFYVRPMRSYAI